MRWIVLAAAADPIVTGFLLLVRPELFSWLIFGADRSESGDALGRVAGIAMVALGLATWPAAEAGGPPASSIRALVAFNVLATIYLAYLGIAGQLAGILLWPAVGLHAALALLLGRAWFVCIRT